MTFSFHPEAKDEFNEAIEYYKNCEPGLGYDFSIEVLATIQNIVNVPDAQVSRLSLPACFYKDENIKTLARAINNTIDLPGLYEKMKLDFRRNPHA
ncbi:MAG: type II toxin-antitoxin system RelE/ParE family toxin [Deltaproteobacteria bacterium]|nr:type II toxin-antitoxin system RelE/ParE family toxin [Deltaproteobacteria bacterium]